MGTEIRVPSQCRDVVTQLIIQCNSTIEKADDLLQNQADTITKYDLYVNHLDSENTELTKQIEQMQRIHREDLTKNVTWGVFGALLGVALGVYVSK
jgi:hypothetical protein